MSLSQKTDAELCDMSKGVGLNQYNYVLGKPDRRKEGNFQPAGPKVAA